MRIKVCIREEPLEDCLEAVAQHGQEDACDGYVVARLAASGLFTSTEHRQRAWDVSNWDLKTPEFPINTFQKHHQKIIQIS